MPADFSLSTDNRAIESEKARNELERIRKEKIKNLNKKEKRQTLPPEPPKEITRPQPFKLS